MPPSQHQRCLPTTYLQFFSADPKRCTRNSLLWRIDADSQDRVQVGSQCSRDFRFSRADAAAPDERFLDSERRYANCIKSIRSGTALSALASGSLLAVMFDLHLRNAAPLRAGENTTRLFKTRSRQFLAEILRAEHSGPIRTADVARHLEQYWTLKVVRPTEGHHFITSDNPSFWISLEPAQAVLHMVLLPLTPQHLAVAYDKRGVQVIDNPLTLQDVQLLNAAQIGNAGQALYSFVQTSDDDLADLRQLAPQLSAPPSSAASPSGHRLHYLPREHHFSFIRLEQ